MRLALCAAVALATSPSWAQDSVRWVALGWVRGDGADACPTQVTMMAAVRARIGRDAFSATAPATAEAEVSRVDDRWRATLRIRDADGVVRLRRAFDDASPTCATIADAVAVSLSLALSPPGEPTPPPVERERPPPVMLAAPPAPPPEVPDRVRLSLGVEAVWGALPSAPAWGAVLRAEALVHARWSAWASVSFEPEVTDGAYAFGMTRGAAGGCWRAARLARVELSACAGAALGAVHAVTFGLRPIEPGNYPWIAVTAEARAALRPWRWLVVEVSGGAAAVLLPNVFTVARAASDATVYAQPRLAGTGAVALGAMF